MPVVMPDACDPKSMKNLEMLINLATKSADWTRRDVEYLINKIDQILDNDAWPEALDSEPKTWQRFCKEHLGYDAELFDGLRACMPALKCREE